MSTRPGGIYSPNEVRRLAGLAPRFNIEGVVPTKYKAIVAIISGLLTIGVPWILQASTSLPSPWPGVIGLVIAALGALGVYRVPAVPDGHVIVPVSVAQAGVNASAGATVPTSQTSTVSAPPNTSIGIKGGGMGTGYRNPWR